MPFRAYCRTCDVAVDAQGPWPGRCLACTTPVEEHPVPDVVRPGLRVLFVGINPGVRTARERRHFANPQNAFWSALERSGLATGGLREADPEELLLRGLGITNVVTRATPGSADVTREDVERGRRRFERLLAEARPGWVAFVGKQAFSMATGAKRCDHGEQVATSLGARAFVLPSTSPANAAVSPEEKLRWFRELRSRAGEETPLYPPPVGPSFP